MLLNEKSPKYPSAEEQLRELQAFMNEEDPELDYLIQFSVGIADEIEEELKRRGWTQKQLAEALGKKEPEISRWLNGMHNFTLKSLAKLSALFGRPLIYTPAKAEEEFTRYVYMKITQEQAPEKPVTFEHQKEYQPARLTLKQAG